MQCGQENSLRSQIVGFISALLLLSLGKIVSFPLRDIICKMTAVVALPLNDFMRIN
jgi:hypothetical protein